MKINVAICGLPNIGKSSLFNALQRSSGSISNTGGNIGSGRSSSNTGGSSNNLARVENFPFCTIDPNVAKVPLPDDNHYLQDLAVLANSSRVVPANIEWVDVAGLVKGALKGEGLGNQFLGTVRTCHAICHVVRAFEDCTSTTSSSTSSSSTSNSRKDEGVVHHVEGRVDPLEDLHTVHLEFVLADLAHVERRLAKTNCVGMEREALEMIVPVLQQGRTARSVVHATQQGLFLSEEMEKSIRSMGLLTLKPVVYAFNVDEVDFLLDYETTLQRARDTIQQFNNEYNCYDVDDDVDDDDDTSSSSSTTATAKKDMNNVVLVSAKLEATLAALPDEIARNTYLRETVGVDDTTTTTTTATTTTLEELQKQASARVLPKSIQTLLDLFVVYTGPGVPPERSKTTRAHLCRRFASSSSQPSTMMRSTTLDLAKRLHGDIAKGFIKAEVLPAPKLLECESYTAAKDAGLVRTEGKDALLRPDDVVLIKWK